MEIAHELLVSQAELSKTCAGKDPGNDAQTCLRRAVVQRIVIHKMGLAKQPVTLTVAQLQELSQKLSDTRHEINNNLAKILAAAELIRYKPQMLEQMISTIREEPPKIKELITKFSLEFERSLGITKP
jgi:hypothetical protein